MKTTSWSDNKIQRINGEIFTAIQVSFGYVLLMIIIGCMAAVLFHERNRIQNIESEANVMRIVRRDINVIHRHIAN